MEDFDMEDTIPCDGKKPHGFDTDAEWFAYQDGRADEEKVMYNWLVGWDGNDQSPMGQLLINKFKELELNNKFKELADKRK